MVKKIILLVLVVTFFSCNNSKSNDILKSIIDVDDLSIYEYDTKFVRDRYSHYFFTIYYKIKIDEEYYEQLKSHNFDDCSHPDISIKTKLESKHVKHNNYFSFKEKDIPRWFDSKAPYADLVLFYDMDNKCLLKCSQPWSAVIYMQYYNGYCYIIFDHA